MRLLDRFHRWLAFRREQRHIRWLRKARVVREAPHPRCIVRQRGHIAWSVGKARVRD